MKTHPIQPLEKDKFGTIRFKQNAIVRYLLETCKTFNICDMNRLMELEFSDEDREQFAQLIGYSVGGFNDLGYVTDKTYHKVMRKYNKFMEENNVDKS